MICIKTLDEWKAIRQNINTNLGFVPTMGNLHEGHLSLLRQSQKENHQTIASIFVNPKQFNEEKDFLHYPKTLEEDLIKLKNQQVDFCFIPSPELIYPDDYQYRIEEHQLSRNKEGLHRPGHFSGVLTVVMKLFNIIKPQRAYFGEKDFQQLELIKGMVNAFFLDIEIHACPTIREESLLPLSSRNHRLSSNQRIKADTFAKIFHQNKPAGFEKKIDAMIKDLEDTGIKVDYLLEEKGRRFAAVRIDEIRLIDNYQI